MYHAIVPWDLTFGAGGAGHGGLVADGKRPVSVYKEKFLQVKHTLCN